MSIDKIRSDIKEIINPIHAHNDQMEAIAQYINSEYIPKIFQNNWIKIRSNVPIPYGRYLVICDGVLGQATYGKYKMNSIEKWYDLSYEINEPELITHFKVIDYPND